MKKPIVPIGVEIWRDTLVNYYTVKARDKDHFLAADGADLLDITCRMNPADTRRAFITLTLPADSDEIQRIADILNVSWSAAYQNINSHREYHYYKGWY